MSWAFAPGRVPPTALLGAVNGPRKQIDRLKRLAMPADTRGVMRNQSDPPPHTKIRAACPSCGEVELGAPDIGLKVAANSSQHTFYTFMCPDCRVVIAKPADERIVRLLLSGGVRAEFWEPPGELLEAHDGPPISYDDLLDLHLALQAPDFWERLRRAGGNGTGRGR